MQPTLSIVLSVHNAEQTLALRVRELLDVLPDLTAQFEVLIVDDGSTDQTDEVAHDLSKQYPQLQAVRHPIQRGAEAALQTGLELTNGDVLFMQDGHEPIRPSRIRQLWETRRDAAQPLNAAQTRAPREPAWLERLEAWGAALVRGIR